MGRKRADIEAAMAELQAELDAAAGDDDAEIWVKRDNTEVKLTGGDKRGFLETFFGDVFGAGDGGEGGGGEGGDGGQGAAGAGRRSYWGSGKRTS